MTDMMRWFLLAVLLVHGLIHLMGFAKAFGFAELTQLTQPISKPMGLVWLLAAFAMLALILTPPRAFWIVGLVAITLSQIVISSSWSDAKFGTIANVIVLLAVVYSFVSQGPISARAAFANDARALLVPGAAQVVTEADLQSLPPPVQQYLRVTGSVGQPRVFNFRATWKGRIRGSATDPWMPFTAQQFNTYGSMPARLFLMDAVMKGLPVDVFHRFVGEPATFQVRLLSVGTVVDAKGPEMNRAETVTLFNDLCLLAPSMLIDRSIRWEPIDSKSARGFFTRGAQTVSAELLFDEKGELVDFISDDRSAASPDGKSFTTMRWSTPVRDFRAFGERRVPVFGEAKWHDPAGTWTYGEFELQHIAFNVAE
ncbi:MAG: hypothetical protein Q8N26_05765 [Myxococcales bacterium]|nr:hypothetical protein [Myxococcales bacterium]